MEKSKYLKNSDYLIPNLTLSEQPETPLGKYGRMRKQYLREHRPALYSSLLLSEKLYPPLACNRPSRQRAIGTAIAAYDKGGRDYRAAQSYRPNEVGRVDEYSQSAGGRNHFFGADI